MRARALRAEPTRFKQRVKAGERERQWRRARIRKLEAVPETPEPNREGRNELSAEWLLLRRAAVFFVVCTVVFAALVAIGLYH